MHANGQPFFWLGDTGWWLFTNLTKQEISQYLKDRNDKGFNVVQVMVVHDMPAVNFYNDTAFVNNDMSKPFTMPANVAADSLHPGYWETIDFAIDEAAKNGIYIALVPAWGSLVKKGTLNKTNAYNYIHWLALRYRDRPNIIWINGGDIKGDVNLEVFNIIGNTIKETDSNHLITYHPYGRSQSSTWFHDSSWLDFNMIQSGHKNYQQDSIGPDNWKLITKDYDRLPTKPVIDGEPGYEGIPQGLHDTTQPYWNENDARRSAYWSVFSGAFGHVYGNNAIMQFYKPTSKSKAYGVKKYWYDALNDPGASQMQYIKRLMLSRDFFNRRPSQDIIVNDTGKQYNHVVATCGNDYAFVYTYNAKPFTLFMNKISGKKLNAYWYDPRSGKNTFIGKIDNNGTHAFNPPGKIEDGNDWVLILDDDSKNYKAP